MECGVTSIADGLARRDCRTLTKQQKKQKVETQLSLNPYIRTSIENEIPKLEPFGDVNEAVRTLRQLDEILPRAGETVAIIDELEELNQEDRDALAFLVKQIGDQDFQTRFVLVGIAENVHELIGAHASVPRYIKEISLEPLIAQDLIDVVASAAKELTISVPEEILYKVAIIGNGFPHFAHLIGKELLIEAVISESSVITDSIYKKGIERAINASLQELRASYEAATQRGDDYFRHMIWSLADFGVVDVRLDEWEERYSSLCKKFGWVQATHKKFSTAVGNLNKSGYGGIIRNTPAKYGSAEIRYRYKRFTNSLMKGHVRLQAEAIGVSLGEDGPSV